VDDITTSTMGAPVPSPVEIQVKGDEISLGLIDKIGAFRSHNASRNPWHSHRTFELLFVLDGSTSYEFSGGRTVELPGGYFLVVPPGSSHRGLQDVRMPATLCGIVFNPRRKNASRNTLFLPVELRWMARQFDRGHLVARAMGPELRRLVSSLHGELVGRPADRNRPLWPAEMRLLACGIILKSAERLTTADHPKSRQASAEAVTHIEQHYAEPLNVSDLARKAGTGRARFFQRFKESTGMTPNDYLQRLRVTKARELLIGTKIPVTEIAYAVGFSSSQYFCNVFRKYTSATPTSFRRRGGRATN
jgi:AraC-like DNA-binding protein/mannose-6-phosphate isomerase-like protein (cupin superfamily)